MSESSSPEPQPPAPRGALGIIFLIVFIDLLGFGLILPALPFYAIKFKASPLEVGLIFSLFSACQFVAAPILGALSDRYGRRPILIISQFGSAVGYVLLGFVTGHDWGTAVTTGLWLLYLSRIIDGVSGGNISTAQAYIADITTREKRARGMALLGVAFGLGFTLGPFFGGFLGKDHLHWPAYGAAILSTVAAILTWWKLPEARVKGPTEAEVWLHPRTFLPALRDPAIGSLLGITFVCMAAFVMMEASIGLFLKDHFSWEQKQTSWYFAFLGVVIIVVQGGVVGRLSKRVGEWPLAIGGPIIVAVGMACFIAVGFKASFAILILGGFLNAAGRSLWQPTLSALLSKVTAPDQQGVVFGLYWGFGSIARVLGPFALLTYHYGRHVGPFVIAATLLALAAAWTLLVRTRHAGSAVPQGFPVVPASD